MYSNEIEKFKHYYVSKSKWIFNKIIPPFGLVFKSAHQRIQYISTQNCNLLTCLCIQRVPGSLFFII